MNYMSIDISVIIPAYNEEKYIAKCITSVKKQHGNMQYEIIVVDNNSSDKTFTIANSMGVEVIKEMKKGVGAARKRGTQIAKGRYVLHLDSDSVIPPNYLIRVIQYFEHNSKVVCLGGQYVFYDAPIYVSFLRFILFYPTLIFARLFSWGRIGPMGGCMAFRNSTYKMTEGFNTDLKFGEDADLSRQLSFFGKVKVYPPLKCYVSSRRFKFNFNLLVLFVQFIKMVFNRKSNYNFPHSDEL